MTTPNTFRLVSDNPYISSFNNNTALTITCASMVDSVFMVFSDHHNETSVCISLLRNYAINNDYFMGIAVYKHDGELIATRNTSAEYVDNYNLVDIIEMTVLEYLETPLVIRDGDKYYRDNYPNEPMIISPLETI